jgi:hypothetical protein
MLGRKKANLTGLAFNYLANSRGFISALLDNEAGFDMGSCVVWVVRFHSKKSLKLSNLKNPQKS